jgi:hypothetical protein
MAQRRPAPVLHSPCPPKLLPSEGWIGEAGSGPAGVEIPAETRRIGNRHSAVAIKAGAVGGRAQ